MPKFYAYYLRSSAIREVLSSHGGGTNISNLNQAILTSLRVPLPGISEQERIADILSAYDDLIEANARRIALLEELARSLYQEWFVRFRFPGHEGVELVESAVGLVPEGWEVVPLSEITDYISRGISPKYSENSDQIVVNQRCIRDGRLSVENARRHISRVPDEKQIRMGDMLINSTGVGTLGRVAQVNEPLSNYTADSHVSIVRPRESVDMSYIGLTLLGLQSHFESMGVGSTGQTELSRSSIGETRVLLPLRSVQDSFSDIVRPIRSQVTVLFKKNANLRQTRDLLLPKLISGELSVEQSVSHDGVLSE